MVSQLVSHAMYNRKTTYNERHFRVADSDQRSLRHSGGCGYYEVVQQLPQLCRFEVADGPANEVYAALQVPLTYELSSEYVAGY